MTDSFYKDIIFIALGVPGVVLSVNQGAYGITFDSSRPLSDVIEAFVERFHNERPWRVVHGETAVRRGQAAITVKNEIDRTCNVFVNENRSHLPPGHKT